MVRCGVGVGDVDGVCRCGRCRCGVDVVWSCGVGNSGQAPARAVVRVNTR